MKPRPQRSESRLTYVKSGCSNATFIIFKRKKKYLIYPCLVLSGGRSFSYSFSRPVTYGRCKRGICSIKDPCFCQTPGSKLLVKKQGLKPKRGRNLESLKVRSKASCQLYVCDIAAKCTSPAQTGLRETYRPAFNSGRRKLLLCAYLLLARIN